MALNDVVVDTNVFSHCDNFEMACIDSCRAFLRKLQASNANLRIDRARQRGANTYDDSLILVEYRERVSPIGFGGVILAHLLNKGRVVRVVGRPGEAARGRIRRRIRKARDRTFLEVAIMSEDKVLASEDFEDFTRQVRGAMYQIFDVSIVDAAAAEALI